MSNSEMMHVRATPELAGALAKAAERECVSQSEIIRRAVAGRLGCSTNPVPDPDPYERVYAAARGDLQAMRDLVNLSMRWAFDPAQYRDPALTLREGLMFARMAATFGDPVDQGVFLSLVGLLVKVEGNEAVFDEFAEAIARILHAADEGSDDAADSLIGLAETATAEVMEAATEIHARLRAQVNRYDPKARLLVHDGHLHGGFNGFYKAPKLGGMVGR